MTKENHTMRSTMHKLTAVSALTLLVPATAFGAGFQVNEHNAAATGRAGAVFATVKDPSAVFYNPAGLVHTEGTELQLGVTLIRPSGTYTGVGLPGLQNDGGTGPVTQNATQPFIPVPNIYAARALSEKAYVGLGFYAPYGLGIAWEDPENFVGRTSLHELSLRTFFITPAIALKLNDMVAVAVSVSLVPATLYLKRTLGANDDGSVLFPASQYGSEGVVELSGSAFGVGANAGVQITLMEHLKLGLAFRSAVGLDFAGQADFQIPSTVPAGIAANFPDGDVRGEVTLPHSFSFGVGWDDGPLTVEASANLTLWQSYDELRIQFERQLPAPASVSPRDWEAAPTFRLGGQYTFAEAYTARLGLAYDLTPVPDSTIDPTLPDTDRFIATVGFGAKFGPINADLAYMLLLLPEREANDSINFAPGTYASRRIDLLAVSLGARF